LGIACCSCGFKEAANFNNLLIIKDVKIPAVILNKIHNPNGKGRVRIPTNTIGNEGDKFWTNNNISPSTTVSNIIERAISITG
jgi:hypothetical protein